jgi:hypothetical protein
LTLVGRILAFTPSMLGATRVRRLTLGPTLGPIWELTRVSMLGTTETREVKVTVVRIPTPELPTAVTAASPKRHREVELRARRSAAERELRLKHR